MPNAVLDFRNPVAVATGLFNPAIFNPGWVGYHIFEVPLNTDIALTQVEGAGCSGSIFFLRGIGMSVINQRLELFSDKGAPEDLDRVDETLRKIITTLPHTPMGGCGSNFDYRLPAEQFDVERFFPIPEGFDGEHVLVEREFRTSFKVDDGVTLNLRRQLKNDFVVIRFNFHRDQITPNSADLLQGVSVKYFDLSRGILLDKYGIDEIVVESFEVAED